MRHDRLAACLVALAILLLACRVRADVTLTPLMTRHAFYRGEEALLRVRCANTGDRPVRNLTLTVEAMPGVAAATRLPEIPPNATSDALLRLPTGLLRSGPYTLVFRATADDGAIATASESFALAPRPNPHRLKIWLWGGGGDAWYLAHGFTTWTGPYWKQCEQPALTPAHMDDLDKALLAGADVGIFPNGGLRDIDPSVFSDPDAACVGLVSGGESKIGNPFHPDVARAQDAANRAAMQLLKDFPQIRCAFFNTEIVDTLDINRNKAGVQLLRETLGFTEEECGAPRFVAPGVVADDDRRYLLHKYRYTIGNGLAAANGRTAAMIRRYRPDILLVSDPYRETTLLDLFTGLDVVSTWTYTNPDPKLMLFIETLRAAARPQGLLPLHTITMLNYPGELAPSEEWLLMDAGRLKVTSWINLSRAPKVIGYYYSSECPPHERDAAGNVVAVDTFKTPYSTTLAIRELSEKVFKPYGPMFTRLEVAPRRIAVLSSAAARLYGKSPTLLGFYGNMQIYHFYTLLAMNHLQADVVFDETIERFGLDDYDVLALPKCDVLTQSVYDAVRRFAQRGGLVIADQYLGPDIPGAIRFDFDFTWRDKVTANAIAKNVAYAAWNDHLQPESAELKKVEGVTALDDQRLMEAHAARLKDGLAGLVTPDIACSSPTALLNLLEKDGVRYLVLINDKREYDERLGPYKAVLGKVVPQTVTVELRRGFAAPVYAYDMLDRKALKMKKTGQGLCFDVALTELGGKIIALLPQAFDDLTITLPRRMDVGTAYRIGITLTDDAGRLMRGLQPLRVTISDPDGGVSDGSDWLCAEHGALTLPFTPAVNDRKGRWRILVEDLTSGLRETRTFTVR